MLNFEKLKLLTVAETSRVAIGSDASFDADSESEICSILSSLFKKLFSIKVCNSI